MKSIRRFLFLIPLVLFCSFFCADRVEAEIIDNGHFTFTPAMEQYGVPAIFRSNSVVSYPVHFSAYILLKDGSGLYSFYLPVSISSAITGSSGSAPSCWFNDVSCVVNGDRFYPGVNSGTNSGVYQFWFSEQIDNVGFYLDIYCTYNEVLPMSLSSAYNFPAATCYCTFVNTLNIFKVNGYGQQVYDSQTHEDITNMTNLMNQNGQQSHQDITNQTNIIEQGNQQAHQDMDKANTSLTQFDGSPALDQSKGQLDASFNSYDTVEKSLFDSGQTAISAFDVSSSLTFTTGVTAAVTAISSLMVSIISAMGEFSVLYTVGAALVLAVMLLGIWRFFGGGRDGGGYS